VFVEDVLRSDRFGPEDSFIRLLGSVSPEDGHAFETAVVAGSPCVAAYPVVESGNELHEWQRDSTIEPFLSSASAIDHGDWASLVDGRPPR